MTRRCLARKQADATGTRPPVAWSPVKAQFAVPFSDRFPRAA